MKVSKSSLRDIFKNRQFIINLIVWSCLIVISLVLLGILVGTHVQYWDVDHNKKNIGWNWITGFILGAFFSTLALLLIRISVKELVRTENYFYYIFLFLCRIGLYFIPFLLAIYIPDEVFNVFAVLWGFVPLVCIPLSGVFPAMQDALSSKNKKLLSQAK